MSTQTAPTTDDYPPQHVIALEKAQRVRLAQAKVRHRLIDGDLDVAAVLDRTADDLTLLEREAIDRLRVRNLLVMVPRVGSVRASSILSRVALPELKPVGRMTDRQRRALADVCREVIR